MIFLLQGLMFIFMGVFIEMPMWLSTLAIITGSASLLSVVLQIIKWILLFIKEKYID